MRKCMACSKEIAPGSSLCAVCTALVAASNRATEIRRLRKPRATASDLKLAGEIEELAAVLDPLELAIAKIGRDRAAEICAPLGQSPNRQTDRAAALRWMADALVLLQTA